MATPQQEDAAALNFDRGNDAQAALKAYFSVKNAAALTFDPDRDSTEVLIDLLTDLRHLCCRERLSFDDAARISEGHFTEEHAEAQEEGAA